MNATTAADNATADLRMNAPGRIIGPRKGKGYSFPRRFQT